MTPNQRAAAERLAHQLDCLTQPFAHDAADLLRELAEEPQSKQLTHEQINAAVLADKTLRFYFALNGGAGPVSEKGFKIFRAVEKAHAIWIGSEA